MQAILQLAPLIPLDTPKGAAMAYALIDSGAEHNLQWVCFIDLTGECWTFVSADVRLRGAFPERPSQSGGGIPYVEGTGRDNNRFGFLASEWQA